VVDQVSTQIIADGPRNAILKFLSVSDGTGETAVLKVDVSTLSGINGVAPSEVQIRHIDYSLIGMNVQILWDATTDVLCWELTPDQDNDLDFPYYLPNNAGAGKTGDILFTTIGASAGDTYSIVLHLIKVYL